MEKLGFEHRQSGGRAVALTTVLPLPLNTLWSRCLELTVTMCTPMPGSEEGFDLGE